MPLRTETEHETTKTQTAVITCASHPVVLLQNVGLFGSLVKLGSGTPGLSVICTSTATDQIHTFKANSDHSDTVPSTRRRHWVSDFSRSWLENLHRRCSGTLTSCKIHVFKLAFLNFFDCLSVLPRPFFFCFSRSRSC